jgi:hypothetical protein
MQIVPLDKQFRISKVIILIINIIAEKGNQAWHTVFNPSDLKQSVAMSEAIQDNGNSGDRIPSRPYSGRQRYTGEIRY